MASGTDMLLKQVFKLFNLDENTVKNTLAGISNFVASSDKRLLAIEQRQAEIITRLDLVLRSAGIEIPATGAQDGQQQQQQPVSLSGPAPGEQPAAAGSPHGS